jgi:hypothetical protein
MFQGNPDVFLTHDKLNPNTPIGQNVITLLNGEYGTNFRSFKHGALHGTIMAVLFAFPILAINALFERKGAKYIFIHLGYWVITIALMGGVICGWA